jgi:hypothetical protein
MGQLRSDFGALNGSFRHSFPCLQRKWCNIQEYALPRTLLQGSSDEVDVLKRHDFSPAVNAASSAANRSTLLVTNKSLHQK